jgi:hypothetical protein
MYRGLDRRLFFKNLFWLPGSEISGWVLSRKWGHGLYHWSEYSHRVLDPRGYPNRNQLLPLQVILHQLPYFIVQWHVQHHLGQVPAMFIQMKPFTEGNQATVAYTNLPSHMLF